MRRGDLDALDGRAGVIGEDGTCSVPFSQTFVRRRFTRFSFSFTSFSGSRTIYWLLFESVWVKNSQDTLRERERWMTEGCNEEPALVGLTLSSPIQPLIQPNLPMATE